MRKFTTTIKISQEFETEPDCRNCDYAKWISSYFKCLLTDRDIFKPRSLDCEPKEYSKNYYALEYCPFKDKGATREPEAQRQIEQIVNALDPYGDAWICALCNDKTVWTFSTRDKWTKLPDIPQNKDSLST